MNAQEFNKQHKVGQPIWLTDDFGNRTEAYLRSEAWELGSGDAVALVEGKSGGWDIDRISPRIED